MGHEVIFVGKVAKLAGDTSLVKFSVDRYLKSAGPSKRTLSKGIYGNHFAFGETYLVFARPSSSGNQYEVGGLFPVLFIPSTRSGSEAANSGQNSPPFQISFVNLASPKENLKDFKITIAAGGQEFVPPLTSGGTLTVVFDPRQDVVGRVVAPYKAEAIVIGGAGASSRIENNTTIVDYNLKSEGPCQYRRFEFYAPKSGL